MPRVRADDYELKSQTILDRAATLFAKEGYPGTKMQDVAKACGATKSMLYHYFPTKEDLLFAMLEEHLQKVLEGLREAIALPGAPRARFDAMVLVYSQKSVQSRRRHVTAMNDVKYLHPDRQAPLLALEKAITDLVADQLRDLKPELPADSIKPYVMMLLGMLNWTDYWYKPGGPLKPQALCEQMTRVFLDGFMAEGAPAASRSASGAAAARPAKRAQAK